MRASSPDRYHVEDVFEKRLQPYPYNTVGGDGCLPQRRERLRKAADVHWLVIWRVTEKDGAQWVAGEDGEKNGNWKSEIRNREKCKKWQNATTPTVRARCGAAAAPMALKLWKAMLAPPA